MYNQRTNLHEPANKAVSYHTVHSQVTVQLLNQTAYYMWQY